MLRNRIEKIILGVTIVMLVIYIPTCYMAVKEVNERGLKDILEEAWEGPQEETTDE